MTTLGRRLRQPFQNSPSRGLITLLFVIAALGFADAGYLTVEHYMNKIPPCSIGSCQTVLTSVYATVFGVPVALGGVAYYLIFLVLLMIYLDTKREIFLRSALIFSIFGFLASLYFLYLQAFVIHAFCQYCLGSAATSTLLFLISIFIFTQYHDPRN